MSHPWAPQSGDPASDCAASVVVTPAETLVNGQPVPNKLQAAQVRQGQPATVQWIFRNGGCPFDYTDCLASGATFQLRIREELSFGTSSPVITLTPTAVDATTGLIAVDLTADAVKCPGIFNLEWGLLSSFGNLLHSDVGYLIVNRGQFAETTTEGGPPTVAEIRLHLRDSDPADNLWLGVVEFDLAEIAACIQRPVEYWNEALPPISQRYNTKTYPFRFHWLEGIIGGLYQLAAAHYLRTHLPYQAGGLSVDDKNKFNEYGTIGKEKWETYKDWVKHKKYSLNCTAAMQSSGSPYGGRNWVY